MKCDDCGRFFSPHKPGWSWLFVPGVSPLSYEEVRERCQDCTARLGALRSRQNVRHDLVSGVYTARRGEGGGDGDHVWWWRSRLPERKGQRCRVLVRGRRMNTVLVEFEDGYLVTTSRYAVRRARSESDGEE